jgi:hypothetical protein
LKSDGVLTPNAPSLSCINVPMKMASAIGRSASDVPILAVVPAVMKVPSVATSLAEKSAFHSAAHPSGVGFASVAAWEIKARHDGVQKMTVTGPC